MLHILDSPCRSRSEIIYTFCNEISNSILTLLRIIWRLQIPRGSGCNTFSTSFSLYSICTFEYCVSFLSSSTFIVISNLNSLHSSRISLNSRASYLSNNILQFTWTLCISSSSSPILNEKLYSFCLVGTKSAFGVHFSSRYRKQLRSGYAQVRH